MFLAHTFEYLLSYTCHNKPLHRNPKKRKKHKWLNLRMTYFSSVFEGWVVHIERIKFVTLPAGLLAWSSHLLVWLSTAVFPCGNRAHIEVFRTVVQISKEATLFGFIIWNEIPSYNQIIGGLVVIGSCLLITYREIKKQ